MENDVKFVGELDLYLFGTGKHPRLWEVLGSSAGSHNEVFGTRFSVWAPRARSVAVIGDMNFWDVHSCFFLSPMGNSGIWQGFIPGASPGQRYKYRIETSEGHYLEHVDPFATQSAYPPSSGSVVAHSSNYKFEDRDWMESRGRWLGDRPMSIYELHLGSILRDPENPTRLLGYKEIADTILPHIIHMGFTHVELMPITEHPFYGSWGYQTTSYYAPTTRYGQSDGLKEFVDRFHQAGIGVIADWAPGHFPNDEFALAQFDGGPLFEKDDPLMAAHGDWGTLVFDYSKPQVRNFLIGSALYFIEEFHFDGIRVDAVASMLYLDYSRTYFVPNKYGGREDLDAVEFVKQLNEVVHQLGAVTIAEESTAFPKVARPTYDGGLGFGFKWNMGWMHDTLSYISRDPIHRSHHHDEIAFGLHYAFSENFVLPLSHDECVHGKGSIYARVPGDHFTKLATVRLLYAWMWAHPGKKLLFMGDEFAQKNEWNHDSSLDWHLMEEPSHAGVMHLVSDLNRLYRKYRELHVGDLDPRGFFWIRGNDASKNLYVTSRSYPGASTGYIICVANFSGSVYHDISIGVPIEGEYIEVLNTDAIHYCGSGIGNSGSVVSQPLECDSFPNSIKLTIAANSVIWFYSS